MAKRIIGNPTVTPMAIPDWNQTDPLKADYIKNKPDFDGEILTVHAILSNNSQLISRNILDISDLKKKTDEKDEQIGNLQNNMSELEQYIYQVPIGIIPTTLGANQKYNFGEVAELSLAFPTTANDGDVIYLTFTSGAAATTLTIDTTNTCDIEVIPEVNTGYEIFGMYNGSIWIINYSEYTVSEG
jgi:hypothetical protein